MGGPIPEPFSSWRARAASYCDGREGEGGKVQRIRLSKQETTLRVSLKGENIGMDLKEWCLMGLSRVLNQNRSTTFSSTGEERYWQFKFNVRDVIRETISEDEMNSSLILFFTVLFPAFLRSAARCEGYSQIACNAEKELIDELLRYNITSSPNEFFLKVFERCFVAPLSLEGPSLDLGIGSGDASAFIFKDKQLSVGSDPSIELVLKARNFNFYERYAAIDMTCIPFPDKSFRSVLALNSFYHTQDKKTALREMARVLAPGGVLVFNDVSQMRDFRTYPDLLNRFGFKTLKQDSDEFRFSLNGKSDSFTDAAWIQDELRDLGFERVDSVPFYSEPLAQIGEFFLDFQGIFTINAPAFFEFPNSERFLKAWKKFLHEVVAPMLVQDESFCRETGKSGYLMFHAVKSGEPLPTNPKPDFVCPQCKTLLTKTNSLSSCEKCILDYPIIQEIPLLIPFYAEAYSRA